MHQLCVTGALLAFIHLLPWGSGDTPNRKDCRVDAFPTQSDFNALAYQGQWYVISISRYWLEIPFISDWFPPADIQAEYTLNKNGDIDITARRAGFLGFGCSETKGIAVAPNKQFPQKNEVSFPGTLLGWFTGTKPYWILRTDYKGFAIIYACWKKNGDGTCPPRLTFLWTLNRNPNGHSPEQLEVILGVVESVCLDPSKLTPIKQTGKCNITVQTVPKDEI